MQRYMIGCIGLLSWMIISDSVVRAQPILVADYPFQNTRTSSVGQAPDLVDLGGNVFATETVNGQSRTVLRFPVLGGLSLSPTAGLVSSTVYSVVMLFRFEELTSWRKILDFRNGISDAGLYNQSGHLDYYPVVSGSGTPIAQNVYMLVVLTRDSAGLVTGYVDGVPQFSFQDTGGIAVIDANNTLRFFRDDSDTGDGENSAGAVARILIYDGALSAAEVAALDIDAPAVVRGDIAGAGDGRVTIMDVVVMVRMLMNDTLPAEGTGRFTRADASEDGAIDVGDVIRMVDIILNLPLTPPAVPASPATLLK